MDPLTGFLVALAVCGAGFVLGTARGGLGHGVGTAVILSWLMPVWIKIDIAGLPYDVKIIVALAVLIVFTLRDPRQLLVAPAWSDLAIIGLFTAHVLSDCTATGQIDWRHFFRAYGEWGLPYAAGRYAIRRAEDLREVAPIGLVVTLIICGGMLFESFTSINPWEVVFGERPVDGSPRHLMRFGFQRAFGPTMQTIFCGMLAVLLTPWLWSMAAPRQERFDAKRLAWLVPGLLASISTFSRGVQLSWVVATTASLSLRNLWVRRIAIAGAAAVLLIGLFASNQIIKVVDRWGDQDQQQRLDEWKARQNKQPSDQPPPDQRTFGRSSALNRLALVPAYAKSVQAGGLTGFGTAAVTDFPPRVPHLPEQALKRGGQSAGFIDNFYLLLTLRFGPLGLAMFLILATLSLVQLAIVVRETQFELAEGAFGAVVGTLVGLLTVWMPYDFGFVLLWWFGTSATLFTARHSDREWMAPMTR
ncbi:O-antigen ligase family protein [Planctomicrobium piriforme]|uniref:O-Antigen ligase n=1 Tax=Planctomicrobium piriforme TaxID=1576369 RepID=A0A1I3DDX6_9PLAN|nr:O-antigen ligase family protein [Planctomicrobium piriforme]SFH84944.1 O-Antigen ligase [Planctomicrobium piriforme]